MENNETKASWKVLQKTATDQKKLVANLLKQCKKQQESKKPDAKEKLVELHGQCVDSLNQLILLTEKVEGLSPDDEPKMKDLDKKKAAEVKKLIALKEQLEATISRIKPEETEIVSEEESEDEENQDEDSNDEDDFENSEEYEDDVNEKLTSKPAVAEQPIQKAALQSADEDTGDEEYSEEDKDIDNMKAPPLVKGPKPPKLDLGSDEDSADEGEEEAIQSNEDKENEEEDEDSEEDENTFRTPPEKLPHAYVALSSWKKQQEGDLSFTKGEILLVLRVEDGYWFFARKEDGEEGIVPGNHFMPFEEEEEELEVEEDTLAASTHSGKELWTKLRSGMKKEASVTDALHGMGAVPVGYRPSTLRKMLQEGDKYTMVNILAPKLSPSNLAFRDLYFNPQAGKIRNRVVRFQKVFQLSRCQNIPLPGKESEGMEIKSRHARVCLFNGERMLSNIICIRCTSVDKSELNWTFNTKLNDQTNGLDLGEFFCRTEVPHENLGVLIELSMTFVRQKTGVESEMSCGWTHFRFFDENGVPTPNKNFDLLAHGGTPFEHGLDIDPSISRKDMKQGFTSGGASSSGLRNLIASGKQPKITLKVMEPNKVQKEFLDTLPDVLVGSTAYLQYFSYYRQTLADALLRDKFEPQSTELLHHPFLTSFPRVADQADIMDAVKNVFKEALKNVKQADKRDPESQKQLYVRVFNELGYPLLHAPNLPPLLLGNKEREQARQDEISKWIKYNKDARTSPGALLSVDIEHEPFDISELAFNVVGAYCLAKVSA